MRKLQHVGIAKGPPNPNGTFSSVEGNTYDTAYDVRSEGVYSLNKEVVASCIFIRLV